MNEYLSDMTDIIESKGGYVDKYIGDRSWPCSARRSTMPIMRATPRWRRLVAAPVLTS